VSGLQRAAERIAHERGARDFRQHGVGPLPRRLHCGVGPALVREHRAGLRRPREPRRLADGNLLQHEVTVDAARALLARHLAPTPLVRAPSLSGADRDVFLKIETGLPTGSFKVRGALYSLSVNAARRPIAEVVAASTGNH